MKYLIIIILFVIGGYCVVIFDLLTVKETIATIVLGVISSFIASWGYERFKNPQKRIDELGEDIKYDKDPSKTQEKINKLEKNIDNNPKIPQEKKESFRLSILELKEKNSKQFFIRGLKSFKKVPSNLDAALEDFNKAIMVNPNFAEAYFFRGLVYALKNNNEVALKDLDKAIELNPEYVEAFKKRGELNELMGNYEEATKDYARASFYKGKANQDLGNYKEAIEDYDEAIRLNPDFAEAYNNRGNMKNKLGRYGEAIDDYDQAILLKPDYAVAYHNRGLSKYKLRKYYEAIKDYDQVILLNPDLAIAYHYRAKCYKLLAEKETDPVQKAVLLAMAEKDEKKTKDLYDKQEFSRIKYAFNLINQKEYKHAIRLLDKIFSSVY